MEYKLMVRCGFVNYLMKQNGEPVGCKTKLDSAEWILAQNKPFRSTEFEDFQIAAKTENGDEYFFEGVWPEQKKPAPKKRSRIKDRVCE